MDFPIIRKQLAKAAMQNGTGPVIEGNGPLIIDIDDDSALAIDDEEEEDLPSGPSWIVQKFGGTSVGKFADAIAEDIVLAGLKDNRIAIVCSARSTQSKGEGTTSRLLRAARHALDNGSRKYVDEVEAVRIDHIEAGQRFLDEETVLVKYKDSVNAECDNLLKILESAQFLKAVTNQTKDMVMSVGEKLSCLYMTSLLQKHGVKARYLDLSDVVPNTPSGTLNDDFYLNLSEIIGSRANELGPDVVPVITGFFGHVPGGLLEQIGRGYTDLCAALTAVGLKASELQIWKEVDGIFTADPRKVPTARLLETVTPAEASELTFYGSEVIHPFTMDQVIRASIPIRIKNVMNPRGVGTMIYPDPVESITNKTPGVFRNRLISNMMFDHKVKRPTAVTIKRSITVLNVHSKRRTRAHGFLRSIFSILDQYGLSVDLISSSEVHVSMALHMENAPLSGHEDDPQIESEALRHAVEALQAWGPTNLVPHMAIISLVGRQLNSLVGISGRFLGTLGSHGINVEMISQGASEINISAVIDERDANRALNVVHTSLFTFLD